MDPAACDRFRRPAARKSVEPGDLPIQELAVLARACQAIVAAAGMMGSAGAHSFRARCVVIIEWILGATCSDNARIPAFYQWLPADESCAREEKELGASGMAVRMPEAAAP
jgi:hypothetical protein